MRPLAGFLAALLGAVIICNGKLVLRVCDGPTCTRGSDGIANGLFAITQARLSTSVDVAYASCFNKCKRSCNVAVVPLGQSESLVMPSMTGLERASKMFHLKDASAAELDRVIAGVEGFLSVPKNREEHA